MMDVLSVITQGCTSLTSTNSSAITAIGVTIAKALGTSLIVWESLMQAISGRQFNYQRIAHVVFIVMITVAFVNYYDSSIPGMGYSIKTVISKGTASLVTTIGASSAQTMINDITTDLGNLQTPSLLSSVMKPLQVCIFLIILLGMSILEAVMVCIIAYGAVAAAIVGLLGPLFIPFLLFSKLEWLFWGWLKAYLGFSFYQVVAAAVFFVMGHVFVQYFAGGFIVTAMGDPIQMVANIPILCILIFTNIYIMFKVPEITGSIFSGSVSGHDSVIGGAMKAAMVAGAI
jgi:type IV secretory pathway VirB6-like protein